MSFEYSPTRGEIKFVEDEQAVAGPPTLSKESRAFLIGLMTPGNEAYARLPEPGGTIQVAEELRPFAAQELLQRFDGFEVE